MKFLTVAVILAIVAFIAAQSPPTGTVQSCQTITTNSSAIAFCSSVWVNGYPYVNGTDLTAANNAAQAQYNVNVAKITNPSASCQAALMVYACQSSLPRCGRYSQFTSIAVTRCNNVNAQCNITGFPTTGGFQGNACINNTLFTVDGPALTCVNPTVVALGASCTSTSFYQPETIVAVPYVVNVCPIVSSCNDTASNPTCVRPNNLGDACTTTCVSPVGVVGSALSCIAGTCQYSGKRFGYSCINNAECLSNNCTAGLCYESPLGGFCQNSAQCRQNLYCDTFNQTCYNVAQGNEFCANVQPGQSLVPCLNGFTCTPSGNLSRCVANAAVGAACSVPSGANIYANPLCAFGSTCVNGVCQAGLGLQQLGQGCNATTRCDLSLTCNYPIGSSQGTCAQPNTVACDITGGNLCNTYQRCNCAADQSQQGTCAADATNPIGVCATQVAGLASCINTNCGPSGAAFFPYDSYSCASKSCLTQQNAFFCCARTAVGANFVAPTGFNPAVCATTAAPTPTPGPTGSSTPTPIQSSRKSGASAAVVSFVAMIIAVVAFCL